MIRLQRPTIRQKAPRGKAKTMPKTFRLALATSCGLAALLALSTAAIPQSFEYRYTATQRGSVELQVRAAAKRPTRHARRLGAPRFSTARTSRPSLRPVSILAGNAYPRLASATTERFRAATATPRAPSNCRTKSLTGSTFRASLASDPNEAVDSQFVRVTGSPAASRCCSMVAST